MGLNYLLDIIYSLKIAEAFDQYGSLFYLHRLLSFIVLRREVLVATVEQCLEENVTKHWNVKVLNCNSDFVHFTRGKSVYAKSASVGLFFFV